MTVNPEVFQQNVMQNFFVRHFWRGRYIQTNSQTVKRKSHLPIVNVHKKTTDCNKLFHPSIYNFTSFSENYAKINFLLQELKMFLLHCMSNSPLQ